jgi:hypothetical protein
MITVKKNYKNGCLERIWPICYRTASQFSQGDPICPNKGARKTPQSSESMNLPLFFFVCPTDGCTDFNHFDADNLSIAERMGKDKYLERVLR